MENRQVYPASGRAPNIWNVRTWCFYAATLHDPWSAKLPCTCSLEIEQQRGSKFHNKVSVSGCQEAGPGENRHLKDSIRFRHLPSQKWWKRISQRLLKSLYSSQSTTQHQGFTNHFLFDLWSKSLLSIVWDPRIRRRRYFDPDMEIKILWIKHLKRRFLSLGWVWFPEQSFLRREQQYLFVLQNIYRIMERWIPCNPLPWVKYKGMNF